MSLLLLLSVAAASSGEDLLVGPGDLRIDLSADGGYHLRIRRKPDIGSILLTESTEDPSKKPETFAYRTSERNPVNGDERRILNGKELKAEGAYFLLDSTPEPDAEFGAAFHIFIPYVVEYGYPWSRRGEVMVVDGTYLSVRAFAKPYADYSGPYRDNPFVLRISQKPLAGPPEGNFMPDTVKEFTRLADEGETVKTPGKEDMIDRIGKLIERQKGKTVDLVIALDTTQSMEDDIPYLRKLLVPAMKPLLSRFDEYRVGLVLYRDYMEEYLVRNFPFTENLDAFQRYLDAVRVSGGRDIPEAVHEALHFAIRRYDWKAENRLLILIGDAPPHPRPRGAITEENVKADAKERGILIHSIILPQ